MKHQAPVPKVDDIAEGLRRITAPNPSPMTFRGTNTYLLGTREITVIDPGPHDPNHMDAILSNLGPEAEVVQIIVTHAHRDHAALAGALSRSTGAPVFAFGSGQSGRSQVMQDLASQGDLGGGEGVDNEFTPDIVVEDGATIDTEVGALTVIHTPGHIGNHICLAWNDCCFTGDHVMGWASTLISPPDGDLTDFMVSCRRLLLRDWSRFFPGHGETVETPSARLTELIAHREAREAQILKTLSDGPLRSIDITLKVYHDTPPDLQAAAQRNVLAHLIDLFVRSRVTTDGVLHANALFSRVPSPPP